MDGWANRVDKFVDRYLCEFAHTHDVTGEQHSQEVRRHESHPLSTIRNIDHRRNRVDQRPVDELSKHRRR